MCPPEPSILAANDDWDDDAAATFISDFSAGSIFTKALIILFLVFVAVRLSVTIFHRCCNGNGGHRGGNVANSTNNPDDHHDEENPDEEAAAKRAADIEAVINSYPCFMYNDKKADDRNNTTCPICMCEYLESEMMRVMPQCGHYFHLKCLDEWLRINWSCPVCRNSPSLLLASPSSTPRITASQPPPQATPSSLSCDN